MEATKWNNDGLINLLEGMISDARTKYVRSIATLAYSRKVNKKDVTTVWDYDHGEDTRNNVEAFFQRNKKHIYRWEYARFVIEDPYSIFRPMSPDQVFRAWNKEAQLMVDGWAMIDELLPKYQEIKDLDTAMKELHKDMSEKNLDFGNVSRIIYPILRNNGIKTYYITKGLKLYGDIPECTQARDFH